MLEMFTITCPYCGENYATQIDLSAGSQRYIEDCAVCCKPIEVNLRVSADGALLDISTSTDRD